MQGILQNKHVTFSNPLCCIEESLHATTQNALHVTLVDCVRYTYKGELAKAYL